MKMKFTLKGMAALLMMSAATVTNACDLSSFTLDNVTSLGNNKYKIDVSFCAGGGKSNTRYGADQSTTNFAFYMSHNSTVDTFSKTYMISPMTGDTLWGYKMIDNSKLSVAYDASVLYYLSWDWSSVWSCINPNCGPVQSVCGSVSIYTTGLPDSIWLRGMEAAGNVRGGCTSLYVFPRCFNSTLAVNMGGDQDVYKGYGATCATISPSVSGGSGSYTYKWSNGATSSSQTFCPTANTSYWVKVTDGYGCAVTGSVNVNYTDVRCGSRLNKVSVCYRGSNKCLSTGSVASYLNAGGVLGVCNGIPNPDATHVSITDLGVFNAYPNPAQSEFTVTTEIRGVFDITMYDLQGKMVQSIFSGSYNDESALEIEVAVGQLAKGLYVIRLEGIDSNGETLSKTTKVSVQ